MRRRSDRTDVSHDGEGSRGRERRGGDYRDARATSLGAPLDTGIRLGGTRERHRKRRAQVRMRRLQAAGVLLAVILALTVGWIASTPKAAESRNGSVGMLAREVVAREPVDPTPLFATYGSIDLYLPMTAEELTELAFHQASGDAALSLVSLLPDADMASAAANRSTGRDLSATGTAQPPEVLPGSVLRMWRSSRSGPCDTAADVGGKPGTTVVSPVSGTVVEVRPYWLYGKYEDVEIHIRPTGHSDLDLVLIHVDQPTVEAGDEVVGGVTPIAVIRLLSDRVTPQLGQYVPDGGDHVHLQLNKVEVPGKLEVVGGS